MARGDEFSRHTDACSSRSCPCFIDGRKSVDEDFAAIFREDRLVRLPPPDEEPDNPSRSDS